MHYRALMAVLTTCFDDMVIMGVLGIILSMAGIGHRRFIWLWFSYFTVRGASAGSVAWSIYTGSFSQGADNFRIAAAFLETVCVFYFVYAIADVIQTLRESQRLQMERDDRFAERVTKRNNLLSMTDPKFIEHNKHTGNVFAAKMG